MKVKVRVTLIRKTSIEKELQSCTQGEGEAEEEEGFSVNLAKWVLGFTVVIGEEPSVWSLSEQRSIMGADTCEACGEGTVSLDHIYGVLACDACGRVVDDTATQLGSEHQMGHVLDRGGTFVAGGDTGALAAGGVALHMASGELHRNFMNREDLKRMEVMKKMKEISAILRVPHERVEDAKFMLEQLLDGDWGQGRWIDVLVGACVYIAIRLSHLPLTLVEVASTVDCDVMELGRMYRRVLNALNVDLPDADPVIFLDRAMSSLPATKKLGKELTRKMSTQGGLLLECARQWFITTGRRPLPVVAAVLALVADSNQVKVEFEDIVREVYTNTRTSRVRYKELQEALVGVGQRLPWGKDITVKTLRGHLPFLLQFLELDMKRTKKRKLTAATGCSELLARRDAVNKDTPRIKRQWETDLVETRKEFISIGQAEESTSATVLSVFSGQPESSQKDESVEVQLVQAMKRKEAKWEAWPRSFLVSEEAKRRRCAKIDAARERIEEAKKTLSLQVRNGESCNATYMEFTRAEGAQSKHGKGGLTKEGKFALDWEDLIIEYLLLRGVNERQLEDGYYKAALALHPMQSSNQIDDNELMPYLRTKAEVDLLKTFHEDGDLFVS